MRDKKEIRKEIKMRKRQFSEIQLKELSLTIINKLLQHPRIKNAKTILMYYSLPDEVYTHNAITKLIDEGKTILLPVVLDNYRMELHKYTGSEDMHNGAFNIKEPSGEKYTAFEKIDVAVIPAVAYDSTGNRVGRGKGYYDRFLNNIPNTYKIGICFDFQKFSEIQTDTNDIPVDEVI